MMTVDDIKKLPLTLEDVNISGGEPFLHKDIVEIAKTIRERLPNARIVISSNGFATDLIRTRITEILKYIPDIRIAISIDGMQKLHDETRRIPDGFNKIMRTLDMLKEVGVKSIRIAFTVMTHNVSDLPNVYDLSREKGVEFTMAFAQSSDFYFGAKQNFENPDQTLLKKGFAHVIKNELKSWHPKRWARAFFAYGLYKFATTGEQPLNSRAGTDFFYLDPKGNIYPSVVHFFNMGNITKVKTFEELWFGEQAEKARVKMEKDQKKHWMICTARTAIKRHPFTVASWFAKNRLRPNKVLG